MKLFTPSALSAAMQAALFGAAVGLSPVLMAQESDKGQNAKEQELETITVTAQKRSQSIQEVPISIATLSGEKFDAIFSSGDDITALAIKVPGLYAETSNGRAAPRFYIRGLGNTDFDLAASQPVSIIMDEVVMENVILKSFPLFDVQQVEVIRGPQGTLFGRNTTAGIIKFDSVKPRQDFDAYVKTTAGTLGQLNLEGAVGGGLTDEVSARLSLLSQHRSDWVDNAFTGENDAMGGYTERAGRLQLLWESSDFDALLNVHSRNYDGTSSLFRANILSAGSDQLNGNYDRDSVSYDNPTANSQSYDAWGASLKLDFQLDGMTLTSISAMERADGGGIGDIDGGTPDGPGVVPFQAVTEDQLKDLKQYTQEIRLASDTNDALSWQVGGFYFDSTFGVNSIDGFFGATEVFHGNTSWALFGQTSYKVNDKLDVTGGIRYTDDIKTFSVGQQNVDGFALVIDAAQVQYYEPIKVSDDNISWELSANYRLTDKTSLFARVADGFRAQSIQGRDVAFEAPPSVAKSETIMSFEVGAKSDLLNNTLRLNGALFYYTIDDIQLSAIGGQTQGNQLINADKGVGYGFEFDFDYRVTPNLSVGGGFSYNNTELQDDTLTVAPCGSGMCTVLDPRNAQNLALIDGNPFPQAPETILTLNGRYDFPIESGEIYIYGDYQLQGKTNLFLYESAEFKSNNNYEAGLRVAYINYDNNYEVGVFGRNITDKDNLKGAIDFNNLTGFVNEPRTFGVDFKINFY
ncbi:MAG: TonB-dependent receptor [Gammaproteobacteria bacterium]|nr:TonB-dependent receptor [Gammaproteobacteria bacterium]MBU1555445.1 TonB-dependent receptor [Gammaproteobacteria bacterium]MBU2070900.1 TonB-dependent receptor [Gammaproteobacteria bacterium]MBU2185007.1 TonB-dependent receptor [Gammaproteobacteria bacterium]MBU2204106.1 TonB-dependent receptor [Gammaproteobacteria bacterium]